MSVFCDHNALIRKALVHGKSVTTADWLGSRELLIEIIN